MTGGGFGGSVIALVPVAGVGDVERRAQQAARAGGHPDPAVSVERPAGGAHRDDATG
jgi:galactokinase